MDFIRDMESCTLDILYFTDVLNENALAAVIVGNESDGQECDRYVTPP